MPENPFESGKRKVIPAVLVYVLQGDRVLMIHRNARDKKGDYHSGKWNGLGGKCEINESPLEAARRELHEESGLDLPLQDFRAQGVLHFPNFKPHKNEDWMVFVFTVEVLGSLKVTSDKNKEGELHWVPREDLSSLNLWPGDQYFIHLVVNQTPLVGTIWYAGEKVLNHWIQELVRIDNSANR